MPKSGPISPKEEIESVKTNSPPPLPTLDDPTAKPETQQPPTTLFESISKVAETVAPPAPIVSDKPSTATMITSELSSDETSDDKSIGMEETEVKEETPKYYWKVVVSREQNPERISTKEFWGELMDEWFRDVLRLSELEKKWDVYIDGEFYMVYGRKIKIGRVIPYADAPANTVDMFLKNAVVLENSLPAKYLA